MGAHRLLKHPESDWKYLCIRIGDEWWANCVGTFGTSTIPWAWGRFYAGVHRVLYQVAHDSAWGLVFVDDGLWDLPLTELWLEATAILALHVALGIPLGWHK